MAEVRLAAGAGQALPEPQSGGGVASVKLLNELESEGQMETYDAHKTATEARQGSPRLGNFWVLIISTGLVVVLFAIIFLVFNLNTPPSAIVP